MVFSKNGDAKFYRYEFAFNFYEELIDCEGSVAFHGDGTFTFYPVSGRKRFYDSRHSEQNVDRALTAAELTDPKLAGKRAYAIVGSLAGHPPDHGSKLGALQLVPERVAPDAGRRLGCWLGPDVLPILEARAA
jgi:hypothetical protein